MLAICMGFGIDLLFGDPHGFPHPVIFMGKLISMLEKVFRRLFPKTPWGERIAGGVLWLVVVSVSTLVPALLLRLCQAVSFWLRLAAESLLCWQILAAKSLREESRKVYLELEKGETEGARQAVSMIVGRDTKRLDAAGIIRAAVETVAENTSDGIVAPLLFLAIGGAPLGFFYKAVNTMDSMLGYVEAPYTQFGRIPARADDAANWIPARVSACLMLVSGFLLGMNWRRGARIWRRDRRKHASPNAAQTEAVCAGLLGIRLGGDACYHGVLHKKSWIGDAVRAVEAEDILRAGRLSAVTACLALGVSLLLSVGIGWIGS